jgi:GntR family transcriptional regulator
MIVLDYQDRRPIYEQIVEKFRLLILKKALPPGSRMPSVRQLAMDLSINPNTIQRAYMELEQEGLIYPVKGKGNYVADTEVIRQKSLEGYFEELDALVQKGVNLGITQEEIVKSVTESCRKLDFYRGRSSHREENQ